MTDKERARFATRRLAIIRHAREVSGNVSQTCRYYGITRQSYYVWLRRYVEKGVPGLEDRSRRPHRSPQATSTEIVGKIVHRCAVGCHCTMSCRLSPKRPHLVIKDVDIGVFVDEIYPCSQTPPTTDGLAPIP